MSGQTTTGAREKRRSSHRFLSKKRRKEHPDHRPNDRSEEDDDDDKRPPPGPPTPGADMNPREITHDTDIKLRILIDGKDKGDFVELETSVKVRWMVQQLKFSLIHDSFTLSPTRRNYPKATKSQKKHSNQKLKRILFASRCASPHLSRLIVR